MPLLESGEIPLPNGNTLVWAPNGVGGRAYYSTEIGGGVAVWDTAMVDMSTLQAAINMEMMFHMQATKRSNTHE